MTLAVRVIAEEFEGVCGVVVGAEERLVVGGVGGVRQALQRHLVALRGRRVGPDVLHQARRLQPLAGDFYTCTITTGVIIQMFSTRPVASRRSQVISTHAQSQQVYMLFYIRTIL